MLQSHQGALEQALLKLSHGLATFKSLPKLTTVPTRGLGTGFCTNCANHSRGVNMTGAGPGKIGLSKESPPNTRVASQWRQEPIKACKEPLATWLTRVPQGHVGAP